jgi:protocatechuate 3,4-dioxygenase beta subunit
MLFHKLGLTALTVLVLAAAVVTGAGYSSQSPAMRDEPRERSGGPRSATARNAKDANPALASGRMFVAGRVLDLQGKPVPNASVMVHARLKILRHGEEFDGPVAPVPIGHGAADGSGRFRFDAPRISSAWYDHFGAVAIAPGYGAGWVELDPDAEQPTAEIALRPEQVIHGRLLDLQGRPARDVRVSVSSIGRITPPGPATTQRRFDGVAYRWTHVNDFPAWPKPVTTDAEGRFTLHGVGWGLQAVLTVNDPRFAQQTIPVETDGAADSRQLTMAVAPAQVIKGRVTYSDTGQPVAHARLKVGAARGNFMVISGFESDGQGRFRVNPTLSGLYNIWAVPPEGQPYLTAHKRFNWPKRAVEQAVDSTSAWQPWRGNVHGIARNGQFEIHGLDRDIEVPVYFLHAQRKLGAAAYFSGKLARNRPVTVHLEPCGTATARLVTPDGEPIAGSSDSSLIEMVVTPGPPPHDRRLLNDGRLSANQADLARIDPINYGSGPVSDAGGRIVFPALIPGTTYLISDITVASAVTVRQLRKEFTVKPGETLDLGDIVIEKPQ